MATVVSAFFGGGGGTGPRVSEGKRRQGSRSMGQLSCVSPPATPAFPSLQNPPSGRVIKQPPAAARGGRRGCGCCRRRWPWPFS